MEKQTEQEQDLQYLQELEDYVKTLKAPTPEQIALYNKQIDFMESIHNEIRAKNPNFMHMYDPSLDREEPAGTSIWKMYTVWAPLKKVEESC